MNCQSFTLPYTDDGWSDPFQLSKGALGDFCRRLLFRNPIQLPDNGRLNFETKGFALKHINGYIGRLCGDFGRGKAGLSRMVSTPEYAYTSIIEPKQKTLRCALCHEPGKDRGYSCVETSVF